MTVISKRESVFIAKRRRVIPLVPVEDRFDVEDEDEDEEVEEAVECSVRSPSLMVSRDQLEASVCRDSFVEFAKRFWSSFIPEKLIWNWHMDVLCESLQEIAERVFRNEPKAYDLVVNIPPGTSKSSITSVLFIGWVWTRMSTARFICSSYAYDLSLDLSRKTRTLIRSEKYRRLFPEIEIGDDQDAKGYFVLKSGGMRYAVGTGGSVTGFHGHFLLTDDPLDPKIAASDAKLSTANDFVCVTLPYRKVDKEVAVSVLIMQRLHQDDPSAIVLKRREQGVSVKHIKLPAEITGDGLDQVRPRKYAALYKEGLLDQTRLSRKALNEALPTLGQYGYAGQMLQDPIPTGGGMFKSERIRVDQPPIPADIGKIVRYWDKAATADGGAYTCGVLMAKDARGRFWVLDVQRGQWSSEDRERRIKQQAGIDVAMYGRRVVIYVEQEPGSGGKESAQATVRNLAGYSVRVDRVTGKKEVRADPFSVQVNADNVLMRAAVWNGPLRDELAHFPYSKYKDQTDASSGAFAALTKPMTVGGLG